MSKVKEILCRIVMICLIVGVVGIGGTLACGDATIFILSIIMASPFALASWDEMFGYLED